ncbi:MAG: 6-carboxytetrahydropterin synthase [Aquificota bacterium]
MPWRIRVKRKFQAAHYLTNYKGGNEPLHGHTWEVEVFLRADKLDAAGVGVDFIDIDQYLEEILPNYTCLNDIYPFSPSAENVARYLYRKIKEKFPQLEKVVVWETENCGAEYWEE